MLILEIWFSNSDVINGERELSFDTVLQFSSDDNKLSLDLVGLLRWLLCIFLFIYMLIYLFNVVMPYENWAKIFMEIVKSFLVFWSVNCLSACACYSFSGSWNGNFFFICIQSSIMLLLLLVFSEILLYLFWSVIWYWLVFFQVAT